MSADKEDFDNRGKPPQGVTDIEEHPEVPANPTPERFGPEDDGRSAIMIATYNGNVVLAFPSSTRWIGVDVGTARALIASIQEQITNIETGKAVDLPPSFFGVKPH